MRRRAVMFAFVVASFGVQGLAVAAEPPAGKATGTLKAEDGGQAAAESWLKIVDEASYAASWEHAARVFRSSIKQDDWAKAVAGVRGPLGKVVSRTVKSREYKEQLPGAPDGRYVIVQFDTQFENKKDAVETLVPMVDPDGAWRVSGYFIR